MKMGLIYMKGIEYVPMKGNRMLMYVKFRTKGGKVLYWCPKWTELKSIIENACYVERYNTKTPEVMHYKIDYLKVLLDTIKEQLMLHEEKFRDMFKNGGLLISTYETEKIKRAMYRLYRKGEYKVTEDGYFLFSKREIERGSGMRSDDILCAIKRIDDSSIVKDGRKIYIRVPISYLSELS